MRRASFLANKMLENRLIREERELALRGTYKRTHSDVHHVHIICDDPGLVNNDEHFIHCFRRTFNVLVRIGKKLLFENFHDHVTQNI